MIVVHRIALDPNAKQETFFRKSAGTARFAYNWALAEWRGQYEEGGKPTESNLRRLLNHIKEQAYPWMLEVSKNVIQQAIKNVGAAFTNFFRRLEEYQHEPDPRRKKKRLKAKRYACKVTIAPRFFPSSKLCSKCGQSNENLTLRDRVWTCPECGAVHQRDRNAAQNLASLAESSPATAWIVGSKDTAILPCEHGNGAASSGSGRKPRTKLAAVKQEPTRRIKSQGLTFPTKVPSDSLRWIGSLKRTSDKSLFPMALGSCGHRITHQLRPINMNGRSILAVTSRLGERRANHGIGRRGAGGRGRGA